MCPACRLCAQVTKEHNEECKRLLRLMGVPVVEAASEAEAQCAVMAKVRAHRGGRPALRLLRCALRATSRGALLGGAARGGDVLVATRGGGAACAALAQAGLVYGVATEDMDALTFGCPRLIRHLMAPSVRVRSRPPGRPSRHAPSHHSFLSTDPPTACCFSGLSAPSACACAWCLPGCVRVQTSNQPINEFDRDKAVAGLKLSDEQFIDFCILCGCDYASNIKGIGPVRALQLLQVGVRVGV